MHPHAHPLTRGLFGAFVLAPLVATAALTAGASVQAAEPISLAISPTHPTTQDTVRVRAHFSPEFCWDPFPVPWNPTTITGRTIRISKEAAPIGSPVCGEPPEDYEATLPALVEGSWSIDFQVAAARTARAFEVTAPSTELFLRGGRFVATATWHGRDGHEHAATAISLGDATGAFWFFDPGNLELTVKMLDGSGLNGRFWVFLASMTDVAYTVTVVDRSVVCVTTPCDNTRVYQGVAGHNRNVLDVSAFR